jgi:hypothetical protein
MKIRKIFGMPLYRAIILAAPSTSVVDKSAAALVRLEKSVMIREDCDEYDP